MALYINELGLTPLRVYVSWFMIALAILFVLIIALQIIKKLNIFKITTITFTIMLGMLLFVNVDSLIANYNVDCYLSKKHSEFDVTIMDKLSSAGVKAALRLENVENETYKQQIKGYLQQQKNYIYDEMYKSSYIYNIKYFNLDDYNAEKLLKKIPVQTREQREEQELNRYEQEQNNSEIEFD
jgi:hypothetical protein